MKILHIAGGQPSPRIWIEPFRRELEQLGELTIVAEGESMSDEQIAERIRGAEVLMTCWGAAAIPPAVAGDPGQLKYVCNITGTVRQIVPLEIVEAGIPVTNWGDAPAGRVAEAALTLMLACLKNLPARQRIIRGGNWGVDGEFRSPMLHGLNVGIYGCGMIGRRFIEALRPFRPVIRIYDPYAADLPEDCATVGSLDELFAASEVIVIHAGLTDETRHSVTAELLAKLPDGGVVINTARGAIIDQQALLAELEIGRLRAGLDVLEPEDEPIVPSHPARRWDNLILTAHDLAKNRPLEGFPPQRLQPMHEVALDNITRHSQGKPLRFIIDADRYQRTT